MLRDPLRLVETAYDLEASDREWLQAAVSAVSLVVPGLHPHGFFADFSGPPLLGDAIAISDVLTADDLRRIHAQASVDDMAHAYRGAANTLSDAFGASWAAHPVHQEFATRYGAHDGLGILALDAERRGCVLGTMLARPKHLLPRHRQALSCVAAHIAAALRLRRGSRSDAAILDTSGAMVHGSDELTGRDQREALRRYAKSIDRARSGSRRRDPEEGLSMWRALLDARYSIVDRFDSDGRRYLIVHENPPRASGPAQLSDRERQVVALAALGRSNKMIGYELGLTASTVAMHLGRALTKLNIRRRSELTQIHRLIRDVEPDIGER